jgi:hypothetical protein
MPGGILHVVLVDGLMQLELAASLLELPGVVAGNAALPVLRLES